MTKLFLASVAALSVLSASAAHAREWQGNMPKPIGKLPSYPPVVCVTPNWTSEPCEARNEARDPLQGLWDFLKWMAVVEASWLGTVLQGGGKLAKYDGHEWNGEWPRQTTKLYYEPGGILQEHEKRWQDLAKSGDNVEIRDMCASGCTMILAYVPRERICFGERSALLFHAARNARDLSISVNTTVRMFYSYPRDIQEWLRERGGLAVGNVIAPASDLWAMGYRKCGPDPNEELREQQEWAEKDRKAEEIYKDWQKTFPPDPGPPDPNEVPIPMTIIRSTNIRTGG